MPATNPPAATQAHTPEPWHVEVGPDRRAVRRIVAFDQSRAPYVAREVCDFPERYDAAGFPGDRAALEPDAARIVACVNACAGIDPAAVPAMVAALQAAQSRLAVLEREQSDEAAHADMGYEGLPELVMVRKALALAKGGAL